MSRITLIVLFLPSIALAQGGSSGLVRHYPFDHSGTMERFGATLWLTFDQTVAASITAETGQVLTVTGTPVKVADGTWPAGLSGSQGSGWLLSGVSAQSLKTSSISDPAGSFSGVMIYLHQSSDYGYVITKTETTKSWGVFSLPDSARFYYSKTDSGTSFIDFPSGCVCRDTACFLAFTYQYITDGSSVLTLYCNGLTPVVKSNTEGPMYAGGNPLRIGDHLDTRDYKFPGVLQHVAYWDGVVLTAAQIATMRAQWLGTISTTGIIPTFTSDTPPAERLAPPGSGTEPFLVGIPANTGQVGSTATGSGGLYIHRGITNLAQRSSFETCTLNTNTEPDGWTVSETAGSGATDVACTTATKAHGLKSVGATISAADGAASITGACLTVTGATAYRLSGYAKTTSGTGSIKLQLAEYSDSGCSTLITTTDVATAAPTSSWGMYLGSRTTDATAIRAKVIVSWVTGAAQTTYIDGIQLFASGNYPGKYEFLCTTDADASSVCSGLSVLSTIPGTIGPYTTKLTIRTTDTGTYSPGLLAVRPTGTGNSGCSISIEPSTQCWSLCRNYDSSQYTLSVASTCVPTASTDVGIIMNLMPGGSTRMSTETLTGSWTALVTGGVNALSTEWLSSTALSDHWIKDIRFYRRIVP